MTTQISKSEMEALAGQADAIDKAVTASGNAVAGLGEPGLDGWQTQAAIAEINKRWQSKTKHAGQQWDYMATAIRDTSKALTGTDEVIAFSFPKP